MERQKYLTAVRAIVCASVAAFAAGCAPQPPAGCECAYPLEGGMGPNQGPGGSILWWRSPGGCTDAEVQASEGGLCHNTYQTSGPLSPPDLGVSG